MEMSNLRAFVVLGDLHNFARTGEQLHLSKPAVFGQIRQLEEEIGEKLYERTGRGLTLTAAGQMLLKYAKRILQEHDEAFVAVKEVRDVKHGLLRFGCGPHTGICISPYLLREFSTSYPQIEIQVLTADRLRLIHELREGRVDVLLLNPLEYETDLEVLPLWQYERVFILSSADPAAKQRNLTIDKLRDKPFILACVPGAVQATRRLLGAEIGFEPNVLMSCDQAGSIKEFVKLGLGFSLLPLWSVAEEVHSGALRVLRFGDRVLSHDMGLTFRKSGNCPSVLKALISVAQAWQTWLPIAKELSPIQKSSHPNVEFKKYEF